MKSTNCVSVQETQVLTIDGVNDAGAVYFRLIATAWAQQVMHLFFGVGNHGACVMTVLSR
jgi:hypothetical protein